MANTDPEALQAAQAAYAASNASIAEYNPAVLDDADKVREVVVEAPAEPVLTRAEDAAAVAPAPAKKTAKTDA